MNKYIDSGWVKSNNIKDFKEIFSMYTDKNLEDIAIGIDAPRLPLDKLRNRYFNRINKSWTVKTV
ncbi:MAG: hypothetical protein R3250_02400, partial [Melioribacteraceae bacterium]|nr:hypothetical protein [Melioribacteraceae bacterium]